MGRGTRDYFTEMCSGSEAGSYLRLIDFVYHSTLGLRVIKKKRDAGRRELLLEEAAGLLALRLNQLSGQHGTHKTVMARFGGKSP